ncbi:LigA [Rhodotorula toruloides]|nr:LigA [Rhodotorula toruloides]
MSSPPILTSLPARRPSTQDMRLTSTHTKEPEVVETMSADEDLAKLSGWVSGCIKTYFPSVYNRFAKADPGQVNPAHPFRCWYGIFPLFCLNYATNLPVHRLQVHCLEHVDYKNVAGGVCAVLAYSDFDSTKSHYLIFHDLRLVIEFPAGTLAVYPSFLLAHSNVSLVEVDSKEDALAGKGQKRGSLVWFAQANNIVSRESGMSLKRAKEKGLPTTYKGLYEHFRTERVVEA